MVYENRKENIKKIMAYILTLALISSTMMFSTAMIVSAGSSSTKVFVDEDFSSYLAMMDITKKWAGKRREWGQIHSQLEIFFADRLGQ